MSTVVIIIGIILTGLLVWFLIATIVYKVKTRYECKTYFRQFKLVYSTNPEAWQLIENNYIYEKPLLVSLSMPYTLVYTTRRPYYAQKDIYMNSYLDYLRIIHFFSIQDKYKNKESTKKDMEFVLESWQKDIDDALKEMRSE